MAKVVFRELAAPGLGRRLLRVVHDRFRRVNYPAPSFVAFSV